MLITSQTCQGWDVHFILVSDFMAFKMAAAVSDIAEAYLRSEVLETCRRRGGDYDRQLLLLNLYLRHPATLKYVVGLNDWHRKGAAPMKLRHSPLLPPKMELGAFLTQESIDPALDRLRREDPAHPRVRYVMTVPRKNDGFLVFLRRNLMPGYVWNDEGTDVQHGQHAEWIILHFFDTGNRLRVSSTTNRVPLGAANRIASGFFGEAVEYVSDQRAVQTQALDNFLASITNPKDDRLPLLEITVENAPLKGRPKVMITNSGVEPIIDALDHFQNLAGRVLDDLDQIAKMKVRFQSQKNRRPNRVSIFFKDQGNHHLVQYDDSGMDKNKCREFEAFVLNQFELEITSRETKGR